MSQSVCQSCGMPLADEALWGTEADGSQSRDYCKYCYNEGSFYKPDETLEGMINTCIPFMEKEGMKADEARQILEAMLPKLKRWSQG
ncbi:MAG: zinc ribbon domain-containing protein [Spirochaetales bacterium]|nr:zinc ribbon domain-containing protein [Spirochaetales bacterium]